jgi:hypothetical protein
MSNRVYLSKNDLQPTRAEDTPVSMRIQRSHAPVQALHRRLQDPSWRDAMRLVRRTAVRIDLRWDPT